MNEGSTEERKLQNITRSYKTDEDKQRLALFSKLHTITAVCTDPAKK